MYAARTELAAENALNRRVAKDEVTVILSLEPYPPDEQAVTRILPDRIEPRMHA
jgi:hypothetical protein